MKSNSYIEQWDDLTIREKRTLQQLAITYLVLCFITIIATIVGAT